MNLLVVSNRHITNAEYFSSPEELEYCLSKRPKIDTLLFAFWSWKVTPQMLRKYKCYGMHTGFLTIGKGKGGSPIDNLIKLDIRWAQLNVFEMNENFDDGKVILAIPIHISPSKDMMIQRIDQVYMPSIMRYLEQDISNVPERFKRIK